MKILIRNEDIKIRKKQAPPSKPFKNKKIYSRLKVRKADFWYF